MRIAFTAPLILLLAAALTGCNDYAKVLKAGNHDYKYEAAKQYYAEGYYNRASMLLSEVLPSLKGTDRGEESLYLLGLSALKAKDYAAAAKYFEKYGTSYPTGIYAEEALFNDGTALYKSTPEPKLDQSATYDAIRVYQRFIDQFPYSRLRSTAETRLVELQDKLIEKEYLAAKLYFNLGTYFMNCSEGGNNLQACIVTSENAMRDYPFSPRREDFGILVLRAKFELAKQSVESKKKERLDDAVEEYRYFINEFPKTKFRKEADQLLRHAGVAQQDVSEAAAG